MCVCIRSPLSLLCSVYARVYNKSPARLLSSCHVKLVLSISLVPAKAPIAAVRGTHFASLPHAYMCCLPKLPLWCIPRERLARHACCQFAVRAYVVFGRTSAVAHQTSADLQTRHALEFAVRKFCVVMFAQTPAPWCTATCTQGRVCGGGHHAHLWRYGPGHCRRAEPTYGRALLAPPGVCLS